MESCFLVLCLSLGLTYGVFGVETEDVSGTEGDNVTLHTDVEKQKDDLIVWYFDNILVARINGKADRTMRNDNVVGIVEVDKQTGSLTILNVNATHSGLYKLRITRKQKVSYKTFKVTVYAHLPIPVIMRNASQCSSSSEGSSVSKCELLCSVVDVSHGTLSWYKGNSLISSISVSDLSTSVSLPLEVENEDKNTYRCVLNNTISKPTKHLDISQLCQPCAVGVPVHLIALLACAVGLPILGVVLCICKQRGDYQKANLMQSVHADTSILTFSEKRPVWTENQNEKKKMCVQV